jgi:hypothetical protein
MQMLYHCNFGAPLLGAGAEVVVPAETIVPRNDWAAEGVGHWSTYSAPTAGMPERVYFYRLYADADGQTQVLLKDGKAARAVTLQWNAQQLPCFSLWKNESAIEEGYVTGLEPGTNYPNPRSFEAKQGRVVQLAPGASHRMQLALTFHDTPAAVAQAEAAVQAIRADRPTKLFERPQPEWCA